MRRALIACAAFGCIPRISYLRADPAAICPGQTTKLSWEANNRGSLIDEPRSIWIDVDKKGSLDLAPTIPTTYDLTVSGTFWSTSKQVRVEMNQCAARPSG